MKATSSFPDRHQNFWQLTCIQSASQSLPGILIGGVLAKQYGPAIAIPSICIGNLILWLIGLGVISMAAKEKKDAIQNVQGYLGKTSSFLMALIMIISFQSFYMLEIQTTTIALAPLLASKNGWTLSVLGSGLGLLVALLSMGGIRLIKWICVAGFPFLISFTVYAMIISEPIIMSGNWNFSFFAMISVMALVLPGTVNLPTFFRHSHSRADSFLALTLITIFDILFQLSSIFIKITEPLELLSAIIPSTKLSIYFILAIGIIISSFICLNLVNIYYSAAALEKIIPRLSKSKGYLLLGLVGTASYAFLQSYSKIVFLENMTTNFIANIGLALLISFLVSIIVKHRPKSFEQSMSFVSWLIGCIVSLIIQIQHPENPNLGLIGGCSTIALIFLFVLFIEETFWAIKKLIPTTKYLFRNRMR